MQTFDRIPPSAVDVERTVLGGFMVDNKAANVGIPLLDGTCFYAEANRLIFICMLEIHANNIPIDIVMLAEALRKKGLFERVGGEAYIAELAESICTSGSIEYYVGILKEKAARRAKIDQGYRDIGAAYNEDVPMIAGVETIEKRIHTFTWDQKYDDEQGILFLNDHEILSREGITLLAGPQGKGKTQGCGAIAAAVLNPQCDSFRIRASVKTALYVDTENPLRLFNRNVRRTVVDRAGLSEGSPLNVEFVNIRSLETWEERQKWLFGRLSAADVPELVIIDGAGDFVLDVNDVPSSVGFVSRLCAATLQARIGIFLTLHNNPSVNSEKARGHLGSELLRKADCSLLLKVEGDTRLITTEFSQGKNRAAGDALTTAFKWDNFRMMHVSCDLPPVKAGKTAIQQQKIVEAMNGQAFTHTDLVGLIMKAVDVKRRAAIDKIKDLVALDLIGLNEGVYSANKTTPEHWSSDND